ncbi:MAG: hypothetical protein ACI8VT_003186, partial [Saprospiraceae bacterium]
YENEDKVSINGFCDSKNIIRVICDNSRLFDTNYHKLHEFL